MLLSQGGAFENCACRTGSEMSENPDVSGFVLAGGHSRRMGHDKAYLEVNGEPLLLRAVNLLKAYARSVTVLGPRDRYESFGVPVLPDQWPGQGPLGALVTGLENSANDWNVFLACDLPLLNKRFVELLLQAIPSDKLDAVVPRTGRGWHPLSAAYSRTCVAPMRSAMEKKDLAVINVLPHLRMDVITSERLTKAGLAEEVLENVNSPADWQRVLRRMRLRV